MFKGIKGLKMEFKGLKNNKLSDSCSKCKKIQLEPINGLIKKFPNTHKFCNGDINQFVLLLKKVLIHMNTWTVGKDLMKLHFQIKKLFTVNYIQKILQMKTIYMLKKYLKN